VSDFLVKHLSELIVFFLGYSFTASPAWAKEGNKFYFQELVFLIKVQRYAILIVIGFLNPGG
jgi:hypothetical protein